MGTPFFSTWGHMEFLGQGSGAIYNIATATMDHNPLYLAGDWRGNLVHLLTARNLLQWWFSIEVCLLLRGHVLMSENIFVCQDWENVPLASKWVGVRDGAEDNPFSPIPTPLTSIIIWPQMYKGRSQNALASFSNSLYLQFFKLYILVH